MCRPGHGRARAGLWGGLLRRVLPAWSAMRPPRRGPGPARLPACGNPDVVAKEYGKEGWKQEFVGEQVAQEDGGRWSLYML